MKKKILIGANAVAFILILLSRRAIWGTVTALNAQYNSIVSMWFFIFATVIKYALLFAVVAFDFALLKRKTAAVAALCLILPIVIVNTDAFARADQFLFREMRGEIVSEIREGRVEQRNEHSFILAGGERLASSTSEVIATDDGVLFFINRNASGFRAAVWPLSGKSVRTMGFGFNFQSVTPSRGGWYIVTGK